jgi:hypothetical protein
MSCCVDIEENHNDKGLSLSKDSHYSLMDLGEELPELNSIVWSLYCPFSQLTNIAGMSMKIQEIELPVLTRQHI